MTASRRAVRLLLLAAVLLAPAVTIAQAPFDMSPEVGDEPPAPSLAPAPAPGTSPAAPSGFRPFDVGDGAGAEQPPATPAAPDRGTAAVPNDLTRDRATNDDGVPGEATEIATPERGKIDRYLLSAANLRFEGEPDNVAGAFRSPQNRRRAPRR